MDESPNFGQGRTLAVSFFSKKKKAPLPTISSESGVVADDWEEELAGTTLKLRTTEGDFFEALPCHLWCSQGPRPRGRDSGAECEFIGPETVLGLLSHAGTAAVGGPSDVPKRDLAAGAVGGEGLGHGTCTFGPLTMLVESDVVRVFCHIPWHVLNRLLHVLPDALSKTILLPVIQILSQVETEYRTAWGPFSSH